MHAAMLSVCHAPSLTAPQPGKKKMNVFKLYLLVPGAIVISVLASLIWLNTAGVNYLNAAHVEFPPVSLAMQAAPVNTQPAAPPQDNTALWIALISSLVLNFFAFVSGMFNTWLQFKLKMAFKDTQASLDENTVITQQTKTAVKESLADRSNH